MLTQRTWRPWASDDVQALTNHHGLPSALTLEPRLAGTVVGRGDDASEVDRVDHSRMLRPDLLATSAAVHAVRLRQDQPP